MPLLDSLFQAISNKQTGQISPIRLAQVIGSVAGSVGTAADPSVQALMMKVIGPWALGIAQHVPSKWMLPTNVPPSCAHEHGTKLCGAFAVGACHSCGRPTCLQHALVGFDAALACWACVRGGAANAKPWRPPQATAAAGASDGVGWAYELLGVEPDCTVEDAKRAYKQKVAHFHPDRMGAGEESKANGDLLRSLKHAYDTIVKHKGAPP